MFHNSRLTTLLPSLALWTAGAVAFGGSAIADDSPPPAAPGNGASARHNNPAWAACRKQADDQKLQPGDARREFMKNCLRSAHPAAPPAS